MVVVATAGVAVAVKAAEVVKAVEAAVKARARFKLGRVPGEGEVELCAYPRDKRRDRARERVVRAGAPESLALQPPFVTVGMTSGECSLKQARVGTVGATQQQVEQRRRLRHAGRRWAQEQRL